MRKVDNTPVPTQPFEGGLACLAIALCLAVASWGVRLLPVPEDAIGFGTEPWDFSTWDGSQPGLRSPGRATLRFLRTWSPALDAETGSIVGWGDGWGDSSR